MFYAFNLNTYNWLLEVLGYSHLTDHVGLSHGLDLAVHLVHPDWMGRGDHSETFPLLALFPETTPTCLKVMGGLVRMSRRLCGGVAHVILV